MLNLMVCSFVGFIVVVGGGQVRNYRRVKAIKEYFRSNDLTYILVCNDFETTKFWDQHIDREKYHAIRILNTNEDLVSHPSISRKLLAFAVKCAGVMRYPCLLTIEDTELKGRFFESN